MKRYGGDMTSILTARMAPIRFFSSRLQTTKRLRPSLTRNSCSCHTAGRRISRSAFTSLALIQEPADLSTTARKSCEALTTNLRTVAGGEPGTGRQQVDRGRSRTEPDLRCG